MMNIKLARHHGGRQGPGSGAEKQHDLLEDVKPAEPMPYGAPGKWIWSDLQCLKSTNRVYLTHSSRDGWVHDVLYFQDDRQQTTPQSQTVEPGGASGHSLGARHRRRLLLGGGAEPAALSFRDDDTTGYQ